MNWDGSIEFGNDFAVFSGVTGANVVHQRPAFTLIVPTDTEGEPLDKLGTLVRPMVAHQFPAGVNAVVVVFQAYSRLRAALEGHVDGCVTPLGLEVLPFEWPERLSDLVGRIAALETHPQLNSALVEVLARLGAAPGRVTIGEAADHVGVSTSRLRDFARDQLGISLSAWLTWRKTELASLALADGVSLADAAVRGGFADQAHFTRSARRLLGTTPTELSSVLRS